jgi:hypothetical protein
LLDIFPEMAARGKDLLSLFSRAGCLEPGESLSGEFFDVKRINLTSMQNK